MLFSAYELNTPGVQGGDNTTVILGDDSEPQPDLMLRVLPEYGGQSSTDFRDYVVGAPELVAEVALSSRSIDLHGKRDDYLRFGVREYLVVSPTENKIIHLDMAANQEISIGSDGVLRVRNFPGFSRERIILR